MASPTPSAPTFQAGSLTYDRRGLTTLFACLLTGDLVFVLIDQIGPRIMPVLLKQHGATDFEIALIVSSLPSILMLLVNPIVSYRSDRARTRWGRRIPFLAFAAPFVSLLLVLTPFAPELARAAFGPVSPPWIQKVASSPTILMFGLIVFTYEFFKSIVPATFFSLLRDVVPLTHMGRFMSLFRIFGALATFILTYWLLSMIEHHAKAVFISVAMLNLLGFGIIFLFVCEGTYPPVKDKIERAEGGGGLLHGIRNYCSECFTSPIYWWMYGARLSVYAAQLLLGLLIFFPQYDLGLGLEASARYQSWPALVWLFLAYPVGILLDKWGPFRVFGIALWLNVAAYLATFFLVTGERGYVVSALVTGVLFWVSMLAQIVLLQKLVHPQRVGQIGSANALLQAVVIAGIVSPAVGWMLNALKGYHRILEVPIVGAVEIGPYRFLNLVLAALFAGSLICLHRAKYHYRKHGGPHAYQAPL